MQIEVIFINIVAIIRNNDNSECHDNNLSHRSVSVELWCFGLPQRCLQAIGQDPCLEAVEKQKSRDTTKKRGREKAEMEGANEGSEEEKSYKKYIWNKKLNRKIKE